MTTLPNRPNTALVIVDVQNGVVTIAHQREATVVAVSALVDKARAADVEVVWVQDTGEDRTPGSEPWQIVPELHPLDSEPLVQKAYGDAFEDTDLEEVLASRGIGRLVVADAHTTEDLSAYGAPPPEQVIAHTNLYWEYQRAPGRTAGTVTTSSVQFAAVPG